MMQPYSTLPLFAVEEPEPVTAPPMTYNEMTCYIWRHKMTGKGGIRLLEKVPDDVVPSLHADAPKLRDMPESPPLTREWLDALADEFAAAKVGETYKVTIPGEGMHYCNLSDLEPSQRHL
jgi:hypothetical protein